MDAGLALADDVGARSSSPPDELGRSLTAEAGFAAADVALPVRGGFGYASEYHVERYWREARLLRIAPCRSATWPSTGSVCHAPTGPHSSVGI